MFMTEPCSLELSPSENTASEPSLLSIDLVSYTFLSHVIGLVRTVGGKCIMKIEDRLSSLAKAIDLVEAVYVDIGTIRKIKKKKT
jgi:hypothetical protein